MNMLRALVVDRSKAMRWHVSQVLDSCGFDCVEASDGADALQFASPDGIDLIVTAVDLPCVGGVELVSLIRRGAFGLNPPPVIVCASVSQDIANDNADEFRHCAATLAVPFSTEQLVAALDAAFPGF